MFENWKIIDLVDEFIFDSAITFRFRLPSVDRTCDGLWTAYFCIFARNKSLATIDLYCFYRKRRRKPVFFFYKETIQKQMVKDEILSVFQTKQKLYSVRTLANATT